MEFDILIFQKPTFPDTKSLLFSVLLLYPEVFHKTFIEDLAHKNNLKGQRLTVAKLKQELRKYRDNGIGNPKLETMAKLKFVWANYHINITDNSQLAVIVQEIIVLKARVRP